MLLRVLGALLREDVAGLRSRATPHPAPDGLWLRLAGADGDALLLPVREDGFQGDRTARLPLLRRESTGTDLTGCDDVLAALAAHADPADRPGFDAFARECRHALDAARLHAATAAGTAAALGDRYGPDPAGWTGPAASLAFDTLAARTDHPVYPASRSRLGLGEAELRAYAPEFHPAFALRLLALPAGAVTAAGTAAAGVLPVTPSAAGLPERLDAGHVLLPVHPLTAAGPLLDALRARGLHDRAHLAPPGHGPLVVPTLSMRTVALAADPRVHIKLPLATATLGLLNRRTVRPGTLRDGAAGQRLLEAVVAREPRFRDTVLLADETVYAHAGHELLAALTRTLPAAADGATVVPLAALLAPAPGGGLVIDHLARRHSAGDPIALLDALLTLLFDWQTTLFGYGIALESHQQNVSLVLDPAAAHPVRLLLKDNDGPRVNTVRLRARLGDDAPDPGFDDPRVLCADDAPVADLFTTITLHLCAGAYAFGLAAHGRAPLAELLRLVRDRLDEAVSRLGAAHGGDVLRSRVLEAPRLPVKAMVTAGTLLTKARSGASDINKHYTTGPNYLPREA
ncbi:IucA/IucC family protein [Streptomyces sp. t39]|uniref:IucA/IucC family protein n=1 Tax=Streptomyces sp. t39 TaxID=1828156 RepID=UPI0021C6EDDD|nr:IucA/IucC family protein [Streptomyces sp. t39]